MILGISDRGRDPPIDAVVADKLHEKTAEGEGHMDDQPIFVAAEIEDHPVVAHEIDGAPNWRLISVGSAQCAAAAMASHARIGPSARGDAPEIPSGPPGDHLHADPYHATNLRASGPDRSAPLHPKDIGSDPPNPRRIVSEGSKTEPCPSPHRPSAAEENMIFPCEDSEIVLSLFRWRAMKRGPNVG